MSDIPATDSALTLPIVVDFESEVFASARKAAPRFPRGAPFGDVPPDEPARLRVTPREARQR